MVASDALILGEDFISEHYFTTDTERIAVSDHRPFADAGGVLRRGRAHCCPRTRPIRLLASSTYI